MNKKASLSLSVNAIVVLILAVVLLGLALGFITGMFGKVSTSFEEQMAAEPEPPAPSGSNPVTLSRSSLIVSPGDMVVIKVGIHNPSQVDWTAAKPTLACTGAAGIVAASPAPQFSTEDLASGESTVGTYIFKVGKVNEDKYLCEMKSQLKCISSANPIDACTGTETRNTTYSKEIIVTVRS